MIPFFLYLFTGAVTGFHVYTLLMLAVLGAPVDPLELVSLAGSLCLVIAAYLSLFKPHAAARLALLASLAIWCFYGPAIARAVAIKLHPQKSELHVKKTIAHSLRSVRIINSRMVEPAGEGRLSACFCHLSICRPSETAGSELE